MNLHKRKSALAASLAGSPPYKVLDKANLFRVKVSALGCNALHVSGAIGVRKMNKIHDRQNGVLAATNALIVGALVCAPALAADETPAAPATGESVRLEEEILKN